MKLQHPVILARVPFQLRALARHPPPVSQSGVEWVVSPAVELQDIYGDRCVSFGEGTNASVNPCLQGAFETGVRAAKEVLESLKLQ